MRALTSSYPRVLGGAFLGLLTFACGLRDPGPSGGTDGTSAGSGGTASTGSGPGTGTAATTGTGGASGTGSATATTQGTGGTDDTGMAGSSGGGECPPNSVPLEPGCGPAPTGVPIIEAGCYIPCTEGGSECGDDVCTVVWSNPCVCPDGDGCCAACGGESTVCLPAGSGLGKTGEPCDSDAACASAVCWDFAEYDPACFGTACSASCTTDADCVTVATDAGAATPSAAHCGTDQRCDLVSTGLGSWACATRHLGR